MKRPAIVISLTLATLLGLFGAFSVGTAQHGAGKLASQAPAGVSLLFTQSATQGSLQRADCRCPDLRILTLRGVPAQVVWFQDRPQRHAGHLAAPGLVSHWSAFGFTEDPPNAALAVLDGAGNAVTLIVELAGRPRYDRARATMRYEVRLLRKAPAALRDFADDADASFPARFAAASLFIDTATARQLPARELGGGRWRTELDASSSSPGTPVTVTLGSGDPDQTRQHFSTTSAVAMAPSGGGTPKLSLWVTVAGQAWQAVADMRDAGPADRVYVARANPDGTVVVQFGDGTHGALLPAGQGNVSARYLTN